VNRYRSTLDSINLIDLLNPLSLHPGGFFCGRRPGRSAGFTERKTASGKAGGGIAVSIPNDVLSVAFVAKPTRVHA
jgi:hypothetical protein